MIHKLTSQEEDMTLDWHVLNEIHGQMHMSTKIQRTMDHVRGSMAL